MSNDTGRSQRCEASNNRFLPASLSACRISPDTAQSPPPTPRVPAPSGCLGEVVSLRWERIELERRILRVEETKTGKPTGRSSSSASPLSEWPTALKRC